MFVYKKDGINYFEYLNKPTSRMTKQNALLLFLGNRRQFLR